MDDMKQKKRQTFGEGHPQARLKETDIEEIRFLRRNGVKQKDIAARFNVYESHISMILSGRKWGHI